MVGTGRLVNKTNLPAAQAKGAAGNVVGSVAFTARVLLLINGLKSSGLTLTAIAARLNASGTATMRSGRWTAKAVSRVLVA